MSDKPVALESLFRCKSCGVRMFWRDCERHMGKHGFTNPLRDLRKYFAKGPVSVPSVPGSLWQPRPKKNRKPKKD